MKPEDNQPATKQDLDRAVESITTAIRAEIQAAEDRAQKARETPAPIVSLLSPRSLNPALLQSAVVDRR